MPYCHTPYAAYAISAISNYKVSEYQRLSDSDLYEPI
jgi:hypothetical protein